MRGSLGPRDPAAPRGGRQGQRRQDPPWYPWGSQFHAPPGSLISVGRGPRSRSTSWHPQPSTCSWRPLAARPCPAWPCSTPRPYRLHSCRGCQVGPSKAPAGGRGTSGEPGGREVGDGQSQSVGRRSPSGCRSGPESKTGVERWRGGGGSGGGDTGTWPGEQVGEGRVGAWPGPQGAPRGGLPAQPPAPPPAAQMVIADLSAPEERPAALGRLGLCFGVGMIFGSLLGGTLSAAYG